MTGKSSGWDAIEGALKKRYGAVMPLHYAATIKFALGGPDPIDGTSVYANESPQHWHFVTFGMSELYEKETEDPDTSGFGFEFTFRLARSPGEKEPPAWVMNFLNNLARYVFSTGNTFDAGHHMSLNGPISLDHPTDIRSIMFARDPGLGELNTSNGYMQFLQVVGLTEDEEEVISDWNSLGLLQILSDGNPLAVTDLNRKSILKDEKKAALIKEKSLQEGSSQRSLYVDMLKVKKPSFFQSSTEISIGALAVDRLNRLLRGRIMHGRDLCITGAEAAVILKPAEQCSIEMVPEDSSVTLHLTRDAAQSLLDTLKSKRGSYSISALQKLQFKVVPSEIRDADGKVVKVVG